MPPVPFLATLSKVKGGGGIDSTLCSACLLTDNMVGPVYRLVPHPQHAHLLLSAVEGNNEVSAWNMETGQKKLMLWGVSQVPPFNRSSKVRDSLVVPHYLSSCFCMCGVGLCLCSAGVSQH